MFVLFTDFGLNGPYIGQMTAVLNQLAPNQAVINLFADAPVFNPLASAHLLAAYKADLPKGAIFLCVIDPGVGSDKRRPVLVEADGYCYIGPDNGLFDVIIGRAETYKISEIVWRPERLSATFHGRDLFAPVAAAWATGKLTKNWLKPIHRVIQDIPLELHEVIYIDNFGNALTGIIAKGHGNGASLTVNGQLLQRLRTFSDAGKGQAFCYENANGLLEIAVNQGRADHSLGLFIGSPVGLVEG